MPSAKPVRWSPQADRDLLEIWGHYATVASDEVANRLLHELYSAAHRAADRPRVWRTRDELIAGLRSVPVRPYLLFFRVARDDIDDIEVVIEVVRVLHERRDLAAVFGNERKP